MPNGPSSREQLTFWSEEPLASPSPSQDCERDSLTHEETSPSSISAYLTAYGPVGASGKTSPVSCHRQEDGILVPSSGRWQNSGISSPTESWTLSTSEWPSDAVVCSLSDTLETGPVPQRYFLSATACSGILRRAAKRGRELPEMLKAALEAASASTEPK